MLFSALLFIWLLFTNCLLLKFCQKVCLNSNLIILIFIESRLDAQKLKSDDSRALDESVRADCIQSLFAFTSEFFRFSNLPQQPQKDLK